MTNTEVHPDAYGSLNKDFYSGASPSEYFAGRLRSLLTMVADKDAGLMSHGSVDFLGLSLAFLPDDQGTVDRYTALESTVLLHHTAEALLRLYLGHAYDEQCPWLAIAALRSFTKFKEEVSNLLGDLRNPQRQNDLLDVFSARSERSTFGLSDEEFDLHREGLVIAVREAATIFTEQSNIYNAAKHGLALVPGETGLSFFATDDPSRGFGSSGLALATLEKSDGRWREKITWLNVKQSVMLIHLWTELIQSLWESARHRYLGDGDPTKLRRLRADELRTMLRERPPGWGVTSFSMNVLHVDDDRRTGAVEGEYADGGGTPPSTN